MTSGNEPAGRSRKSGADARAERLAAALKENLKKRKEQARARRRPEEANAPASPASKDPTER
ncbi:MAG TPA: hypothetical protein VGA65_01000 [Hyphomicrobium sp.]|jgi:hypothetical protein